MFSDERTSNTEPINITLSIIFSILLSREQVIGVGVCVHLLLSRHRKNHQLLYVLLRGLKKQFTVEDMVIVVCIVPLEVCIDGVVVVVV